MQQRAVISFASGAILAILGSSVAEAASSQFCGQYARAAIVQVRLALSSPGCTRGLEGARWSADEHVHFDWCLGAAPVAAQEERNARTGFLRMCRGR